MIRIVAKTWEYGSPGWSRALFADDRLIVGGPGPEWDRYYPPLPSRLAGEYVSPNAPTEWELTPDDAGELIARVLQEASDPGRDKRHDPERREVYELLREFIA